MNDGGNRVQADRTMSAALSPGNRAMADGGLYELLAAVYPRVTSIQAFISDIDDVAPPVLVETFDTDNYKRFISQLIVCIPREAKPLWRPVNFQQLSTQSEVVMRVVQRICEKRKRNVLTFGYSNATETSFIPVRSTPNVQSYQINTTTAVIKTSVLWKTLVSRIGDDVMMYLLEHCSLFRLVPPSCCFQLCGVPIYSLLSCGTQLQSAWLRQRPVQYQSSLALRHAQKKVNFYREFLSRRRKWKEGLSGDGNLLAKGAVSTEPRKQNLRGPPHAVRDRSVKRARLEADTGRWTSDDMVAKAGRSLKRSLGEGRVEAPAKRLRGSELSVLVENKVTEHERLLVDEESCESPEAAEQSGSVIDHSDKGSVEWTEVTNVTECKSKYPKFTSLMSSVDKSISVVSKRQGTRTDARAQEPTEGKTSGIDFVSSDKGALSPVAEGQDTLFTRLKAKSTVMHCECGQGRDNFSAAESGEQSECKEMECARMRKSEHGGREMSGNTECTSTENTDWNAASKNGHYHTEFSEIAKPKYSGTSLHPPKDAPSIKKKSWSEIYIERGSIMYCNNNSECLPKTFILNQLQEFSTGGQRLVEGIFLNRNASGAKMVQVQNSNHRRRKRFPKRYWQMRNIFLRLLRNHKRCPYLQILSRNCQVSIQKGGKVSKASRAASNNEPDSSSVTEKALGLSISRAAGSKPNTPVSSSGHQIEKRQQILNKSSTDHFSVNNDLPGHNSTPGRHLEECARSWRSLECAERSCPPDGEASEPRTHETIRASAGSCGSDKDMLLLLKQYSSPLQVYRFVRECLIRVISDELWGSNHNKCRFLKNVKKFISLGKFDKFSCSELMWKMRVNDCVWLQLNKAQHFVPASEHQLREDILCRFLFWLMDVYVVHLLKSFFYITETTFMKNTLFYYRKRVWKEVQRIGMRNHLAKVQLQPISCKDVEQKLQQKSTAPPSSLRFIPKKNGLRPIVKMRSIAGSKSSGKGRNLNWTQLKVLFDVLNYECQQKPSLKSSSVYGLDDIYKAWREFVLHNLKAEKVSRDHPYYFVKVDVAGAYDAIPHAKLMEVISGILDLKVPENYCIRRYAKIWVDAAGQVRKTFKRQVSTLMDLMPTMKEFVSHLQQKGCLQNTILVNQGLTLNQNSEDVFTYFKQMIESNIISIGGKYYVQCCGIPQGSLVSALLCSLCYGDMENKLLSGIQEDGLMMRLIDDFLLVTPHLSHAKKFLRTLAAGIPEYGCFISPHKTVVNFPVDEDIPDCKMARSLPEHSLFPWCGLLFDTQTLEIYCDYSSYANISIRSSLTFSCSSNAGQNMKRKLLAVLKLKCHHIFLDLEINTLRTVAINVYKIFLLQAYRFHACVLRLPFGQRIKDNPSFFLDVIFDIVTCCYTILKAKNRGVSLGSKGACGPFPFEASQWLCCCAFIVKLSSHKAVYKCLLGPLKTCKAKLQKILPHSTLQLLQNVTQPSLHQDFAAILD
ncbi:telomerase reverse transcriptase [Hypanus sabinus]|uniref:telomerase reverse transcriptase n=1 Tax=Hypanus sabinus TaxID=79690 RepID=UPI0028C43D65|nr:telomerase reverse transcriptase [Hypanus sabinus]XP_059801267.1 telomerase reverse transcriptase [Hypanus sabinus]